MECDCCGSSSLTPPRHLPLHTLPQSHLLTHFACPAFVQPCIDRDEAENVIERVYVDFGKWEEQWRIYYHIVLTGENAWSAHTRTVQPIATHFYRANNSHVWGRTADVNTMFVQYRPIAPSSSHGGGADGLHDGDGGGQVRQDDVHFIPVGVGFPRGKFSGEQSFFHSHRSTLSIPFLFRDVILCDDFVRPSREDEEKMVPNSDVFRLAHVELAACTSRLRPIVYLNTCNHLMHVKSTNPDLPLYTYRHGDFEWEVGSYEDAEAFAVAAIPNRASWLTAYLLSLLGLRF
jgi:hypothetical protein